MSAAGRTRRFASTLREGEDAELFKILAKLTSADAALSAVLAERDAEMRRLYAAGVEVRDLVAVTGLSATQVHSIVRGARP